MSRQWKWVWTAVAGVIGTAAAAIGIWEWINRPRPDLAAVAEFGPFAAPFALAHRARDDSAARADASYWLQFRARTDPVLADSLARNLIAMMPEPPIADERLRSIGAFGEISVVNEGTQAAKDVRVVVDDASILCVVQERQQERCFADSNVVRIPELHAAEKLRIKAWLRYPLSSVSPGDVRLTHADGVTDVIMRLPTHPRYRWIEQNAFLIAWNGAWVTLLFVALIWLNGGAKRRALERATGEPEDSDR